MLGAALAHGRLDDPLGQYGLRHGVELKVNWPGRISVFPIMGGIALALLFDGWLPAVLLVVGVCLAIVATALYAREGVRAVRAQASAQGS